MINRLFEKKLGFLSFKLFREVCNSNKTDALNYIQSFLNNPDVFFVGHFSTNVRIIEIFAKKCLEVFKVH